jgi:hypothetical protein
MSFSRGFWARMGASVADLFFWIAVLLGCVGIVIVITLVLA